MKRNTLLQADTEGNVSVHLKQRYLQATIFAAIIILIVTIASDIMRVDVGTENLFMGIGIAISIGLIVAIRAGYFNPAGLVFLILAMGISFYYDDIRGLLPATMAVITAAVLLKRGLFWLALLVVIGFRGFLFLRYLIEYGASDDLGFWTHLSPLTSLVMVAFVMRYFIQVLEENVRRADRNMALVQATNEIGQVSATTSDLSDLFASAVELIKTRFGFYHVQIFMVNGDQAEVVASTGEVGKQLLASRHRLQVGSNSVIGRVTNYGVVTKAHHTDALHRHNPLLPNTRSELAVPMTDGNTVIGALDLQSTENDAFSEEDIEALQSTANLLAAAIRNARLFEEQQRSIREQQRLYQQAEASLQEIQRLNRQMTKASWEDFIRQSDQKIGITLQNEQVIPDAQWTTDLIEAVRQQQVVMKEANGRAGVVAVPVTLRGEVIGAIEVEVNDSVLQHDAVEMVQAIAQRLATSLENARLFETTQATTAQEQRINQIVSRYQAATTVDDLLRITLSELSETLGAQRGAIRLGFVPDEIITNGGSGQ